MIYYKYIKIILEKVMKIEQLMNRSPKLNEKDRQLLQFIIHNKKEIAFLNTQAMATFCHVSRTTLLRVSQKLGLSTISDLQMLLQNEQKQEMNALSFDKVCTLYHEMIDAMEKIPLHDICRLLDSCKTIYIYGTGNEQKTMADECKRMFASVGKCVIELFDYGEVEMISESIEQNDLFIIISLSGETKEGIQVAEFMKNRKVKLLSITRLQNNTIASLCDYHLYVTTSTIATHISYELVAGFYMLLEHLLLYYINYQKGDFL